MHSKPTKQPEMWKWYTAPALKSIIINGWYLYRSPFLSNPFCRHVLKLQKPILHQWCCDTLGRTSSNGMYFTGLLYDLHGNMFLWSCDCMQWLGQFDVTTCLASSFGSDHAIITRCCSLPFPTPRVPNQVGRDKPTLPGICCNVAWNRNSARLGDRCAGLYTYIYLLRIWRIGSKFA